jgi:RNase P subunit RPR2
MTAELPPGVLVNVKKIKERCGKCNKPLTMETYLEILTEKRSFRILCNNCNYVVPLEEDIY